jgi:hypothetical protein
MSQEIHALHNRTLECLAILEQLQNKTVTDATILTRLAELASEYPDPDLFAGPPVDFGGTWANSLHAAVIATAADWARSLSASLEAARELARTIQEGGTQAIGAPGLLVDFGKVRADLNWELADLNWELQRSSQTMAGPEEAREGGRSQQLPAKEPEPEDPKLTAVERAMQIYARDPNQSLRAVARQVGCDPSLLSRDARFKRLRESYVANIPRGSKSKEGTVEAEQEEE